MNKWQKDVREFHLKYGALVQEKPGIPDEKTKILRHKLIVEEVCDELLPAIKNDDIEEVTDAIADSIYVLLGTAVSYGIDLELVWEAVHESNMKKIGRLRDDGKVTKPVGWEPPDILSLLKRQGYNGCITI